MPAALERFYGVTETGRFLIGGDVVDPGAVRRQRPVEGRAEMLRLDRGQRRQAERAGPVFQQGVFGGRCRVRHGVHLAMNGRLGYPRSARSALKMTATSITSCNSAPSTGGRSPSAATIMAMKESPMPAITLCRAIKRERRAI